MLIEEIIKFKLRGPGSLSHICTPATGYFYDKTKICKENYRMDCYLLQKCCTRQRSLLSLTWAKSLTKFNHKMQDFKRVLNLGLTCKVK